MSLFETASLVITPNGIKEDKLYAIKPTDGSGDLVVTRATTATRVNSAGLIEVVPRNLFTYSEQFQNADWLAGGSGAFVVTTNSATAPNGTLTAEKLIAPLANQTIRQNKASINTNCTLSVYLKTNSGTKQMRLFINDNQIESIVNVTSDWQRFTLSGTTGGTLIGSGRVGLSNIDILNESSFVYIWGAQFENFATATEYFPTTTRLNIPRIDYTNGSCPSLLVEPQRTNLNLRSEEIDNVEWFKSDTTVTANATSAPNGILTADKIIASATNTNHIVYPITITTTPSTAYTFSYYAKSAEYTKCGIRIGGPGYATTPLAAINLTNGAIISQQGFTSLTVINANNGWYRIQGSFISGTGLTPNIQPLSDSYTIVANNFSYLGNGTSGIFAWGAQLEAGSYATSYIPTVASTVTRNADVISKTSISSLIGQTEGTIYAEIKVTKLLGAASRYVFHLSDGTANNRIYIAFSGADSNVLRARIFSGGTLQCSINSSALTSTGTYKLAMAYKNNDIVFYINGVQIGTDTSATIPTCSRVDVGHNYAGVSQLSDGITNANIFKTRLTNTELATLTTL
jgi:hypothetical protein